MPFLAQGSLDSELNDLSPEAICTFTVYAATGRDVLDSRSGTVDHVKAYIYDYNFVDGLKGVVTSADKSTLLTITHDALLGVTAQRPQNLFSDLFLDVEQSPHDIIIDHTPLFPNPPASSVPSAYRKAAYGAAVVVGGALLTAGAAALVASGVGPALAIGAFLMAVGKAVLAGFFAVGMGTTAAALASGVMAGAGAGLMAYGLYGLFKKTPSPAPDVEPALVENSQLQFV